MKMAKLHGRGGRLALLLVLAIVCVASLFLPGIALASDEPVKTGLQAFTDQVLAVLAPIFVAFIGSLATYLLYLFQKKTGIQVSDATRQQWEQIARKAALRGAEWARKKAKESTDGKKVPGPEVLDQAVLWATQLAQTMKLPELARDELVGLIEAKLFELRLENDMMAPAPTPGAELPTKV